MTRQIMVKVANIFYIVFHDRLARDGGWRLYRCYGRTNRRIFLSLGGSNISTYAKAWKEPCSTRLVTVSEDGADEKEGT